MTRRRPARVSTKLTFRTQEMRPLRLEVLDFEVVGDAIGIDASALHDTQQAPVPEPSPPLLGSGPAVLDD